MRHPPVEASVQVVRGFVRLRQVLATHKVLAAKLAEFSRYSCAAHWYSRAIHLSDELAEN